MQHSLDLVAGYLCKSILPSQHDYGPGVLAQQLMERGKQASQLQDEARALLEKEHSLLHWADLQKRFEGVSAVQGLIEDWPELHEILKEQHAAHGDIVLKAVQRLLAYIGQQASEDAKNKGRAAIDKEQTLRKLIEETGEDAAKAVANAAGSNRVSTFLSLLADLEVRTLFGSSMTQRTAFPAFVYASASHACASATLAAFLASMLPVDIWTLSFSLYMTGTCA